MPLLTRSGCRAGIGAPVAGAGVKPEGLGRGRSVLIVDDVAFIRKGVARAFSSYGFVICGEAGCHRSS
jgi:hypothetical protein